LVGVADQSQPTNTAAIGEKNVLAIRLELPACLLVLHGAVIVLKFGIALLARLLCFAVFIETGNSEPRSISTGLSSLRVETIGKNIVFRQYSTVALQVLPGDPAGIHPQAQALVPNELDNPDGFIDSRVLLLGAIQFVLVDQHPSCSFRFSLLD